MSYRQPFSGSFPITQKYGEKITDPKGHTGIDFACPPGTNILASAPGTVMFAGWDPTGYGNMVIIRHDDDCATLYAHLSLISVRVGQIVRQGEKIGESGSTGNSTGPHLHFESRQVWNKYNSHFDPMELPLLCVDDSVVVAKNATATLKGAENFHAGDLLKITAPDGAKAFFDTTFDYPRVTGYLQGTPLFYTGETTVRKDNGLTYMRVAPALFSVWIAVNDGETQILDKAE